MNEHPGDKADTIRRFARHYHSTHVDFDRSGIIWLDGFIDQLREKKADIDNEQRICSLGSFFGTCVIKTIGGHWACDDDCWRLVLLTKGELDPFQSVRLHLQFGQKHSVLECFEEVAALAQKKD